MKPIQIQVSGLTPQTPPEICQRFLDTERWSDFEGYAILPGIASARFEHRSPGLVGSRIRVLNRDGSSHVEEIIEWDPEQTIAMKFQEFSPPLRQLASHFVERWQFSQTAAGTQITRSMEFYPKHFLGWMMLQPIAQLMKKAFEKSAGAQAA